MNPFIYFLNYYFEQASENTKQQNQENFEREFQLLLSDFNKINHHFVNDLKGEIERTKSVLAGLLGIYYPNSLWSSWMRVGDSKTWFPPFLPFLSRNP
ncbi:MAG: hypothetical protein HC892_00990 [Saprospiraceae bacterium]|nr:hypothetical protein [Saprospiraceae bacterium]